MQSHTLDLDAYGVRELDSDALAAVNGGFGWGDIWGGWLVKLAYDTVTEFVDAVADFFEFVSIGAEILL